MKQLSYMYIVDIGIIHQLDKYKVTYKLSNLKSFRELSKVKYVLLNHICKVREKVIRHF